MFRRERLHAVVLQTTSTLSVHRSSAGPGSSYSRHRKRHHERRRWLLEPGRGEIPIHRMPPSDLELDSTWHGRCPRDLGRTSARNSSGPRHDLRCRPPLQREDPDVQSRLRMGPADDTGRSLVGCCPAELFDSIESSALKAARVIIESSTASIARAHVIRACISYARHCTIVSGVCAIISARALQIEPIHCPMDPSPRFRVIDPILEEGR